MAQYFNYFLQDFLLFDRSHRHSMWFHVEIKFSFFEPPYKTTIMAANRRRKKVVNAERKKKRETERDRQRERERKKEQEQEQEQERERERERERVLE